MLYGTSTVYHLVKTERLKELFRTLDHAAIYLLIAGTYTPFTLVTMRGRWGWPLFAVVWTLAAIGIAFKILFVNRFQVLTMMFYLVMGWLVLLVIKEVISVVAMTGLVLLAVGGITYSFGYDLFCVPQDSV